jgi:hypothetical protein
MYPALKWLVSNYPLQWLLFTLVLWLFYIPLIFIESQGLFFFSVGVWLRISNRNIERIPRWYSLGLSWILFAGLCAIKTFMAYELEPGQSSTTVTLAVLHKMAVMSGVLAVWFSVDKLARHAMDKPWFRKATDYSFFIYGLHIPLQAYVMQFFEMQWSAFPMFRLTTYLLVPVAVVAFCIVVASLAHRYLPKSYYLFSGGRGI